MENGLIEKQNDNTPPQLRPFLFKKGVSGNPGGRPKGPSFKKYAREYLSLMDEEERLDLMNVLSKEFVIRMAEGNPKESIAIEESDDPYANSTDKQLQEELTSRGYSVAQGIRPTIMQEQSNVLDGGNSEVSKDGKNPQSSGTIPNQIKDKQEGNNTLTEEPLKDNGGNDSLDSPANTNQS